MTLEEQLAETEAKAKELKAKIKQEKEERTKIALANALERFPIIHKEISDKLKKETPWKINGIWVNDGTEVIVFKMTSGKSIATKSYIINGKLQLDSSTQDEVTKIIIEVIEKHIY